MSHFDSLYERIIEPVEDRMIQTVWRIVRDADDAQDAMQEASTVILKRIERIRRHPNPQALVLRICIDEAYSLLRKRYRVKRVEIDNVLTESLWVNHDTASSLMVNQEIEEEIHRAIGELPPSQSVAVFMRLVQGDSYSLIGDALDCSEVTARKHAARGRARLILQLSHLLTGQSKEKAS